MKDEDDFPLHVSTPEARPQKIEISLELAMSLASALARMESLDEDVVLTDEELQFVKRYDV